MTKKEHHSIVPNIMNRFVVIITFVLYFMTASSQVRESYVGRLGNQYTTFYVALPIQNPIPARLDSILAKELFHISNSTIKEAYSNYKQQYDELLKASKENRMKAGKRYHSFKITWIGFEEDVYASCIVEAKAIDSEGKQTRRLRWSILYDIKNNKRLNLSDVFSLPTLSELEKINATKCQMLIKQRDSLILQFMQNNELKEAVFPIQGNTRAFNTRFLSLFESNATFLANNSSKVPSSDVDTDIPQLNGDNENMFAVIIANENYQEEVKVEYALNDGETFWQYCHKVLGLPEDNIHIRKDATRNNLIAEMAWMQKVAEAYKGQARFIVYYAGHGIPDEKSGTSYLLPVDGKGTMLETGYSLQQFYKQLGDMPSGGVTVFMDACFSGSKRGDGMLASARGVAVKAKAQALQGKMVVFSAAQGDETAYPFKAKEHGLFTYYILKKLKETRGNVSLGELGEYVTDQVARKSIVANGKSQTPCVSTSASVGDTWKGLKLK